MASAQNMFRKVNDFDGDGKADLAITRAENGTKVWWVWRSRDGFSAFQWGLPSDQNAAGDYDGDGRTDYAVYREHASLNLCTIYIYESGTGTFSYKSFFRHNANRPMSQDYDGDGKTDPASLASDGAGGGVAYFQSTNGTLAGFQIPSNDFALKIGDMTGDGRADTASFNSGSSLVRVTDIATSSPVNVAFGVADDRFLAADFDGDSKGDLTVFRPSDGTWWWLRSSDNVINATTWGVSGDQPVPADYDGDGKTDIAIYRNGTQQAPQSYLRTRPSALLDPLRAIVGVKDEVFELLDLRGVTGIDFHDIPDAFAGDFKCCLPQPDLIQQMILQDFQFVIYLSEINPPPPAPHWCK